METKEEILKRLLKNNHITIDELFVLNKENTIIREINLNQNSLIQKGNLPSWGITYTTYPKID